MTDQKQVAADRARIIRALRPVFHKVAKRNMWIDHPNILLDGDAPIDLIERGEIDRVLSVVDGMIDCVYI